MKIDLEQRGEAAILRLEGRLDVAWAEHVRNRAQDVLRTGRHVLLLDAANVVYLSSAGIRTLIQLRRDVKALDGRFHVIHPSDFVEGALRMTGLADLLATEGDVAELTSPSASGEQAARGFRRLPSRNGMVMESIVQEAGGSLVLDVPATWVPWHPVEAEDIRPVRLTGSVVALGIGAASPDPADARERFGEFLAAAGCLCWQPADEHPHVPDFVMQEGRLIPEIHAIQALVAEGTWRTLLRFSPEEPGRVLPLSGLAEAVLQSTDSEAAGFVVLAESAGLVGMALSRSPGRIRAGENPGHFPDVRDWLHFCGDRVHADATALVAGVVVKESAAAPLASWLSASPSLKGARIHAHAVAFPYRPLPEGAVSMCEQVRRLFDGANPLDLLHLVEDDRPLIGLGQSSFVRGACWCSPLRRAGEGAS